MRKLGSVRHPHRSRGAKGVASVRSPKIVTSIVRTSTGYTASACINSRNHKMLNPRAKCGGGAIKKTPTAALKSALQDLIKKLK